MTPLSHSEKERYARHLTLPALGEEGQLKLKQGHVALIGLGGLGSPAAFYLAAAGVGRLTIIDHDTVGISNLQRQILHTEEALHTPKAASAQTRLKALNGGTRIIPVTEKLTAANAPALLAGCDVIVDAADNYAARFIMADAAEQLGIAMVHGAVKGFTGQVAVFAPHLGTPCYRCLFSENTPMEEEDTATAAGIIGAHAGIIGSIQALEAIKLLAGIKSPLQGAMLAADTLRMRFTTVPLVKNPACRCAKNPPSA